MRVIEELVRKLKENFGERVESIIIFGSCARGECREESDVDVLIVGDVKLDEVIDVVYPIFLKYRIYISPIVMTRDHFELLKMERTGFIENVLKDGITLYGRA